MPRSLMRLAVATYRFQAKRGRLPGSLDELVPDWIPTLPLDPFDGKPMRMKKTDRGLVLYTLFPYGIDYGALPTDPMKWIGNTAFQVRQKPAMSSGRK